MISVVKYVDLHSQFTDEDADGYDAASLID
jgi:hypothetical protein